MLKCSCGAYIEEGDICCSMCGKPVFKSPKKDEFRIAEKAVVAGDQNITTNITNHIDETKKVIECHICGKHLTNDNGHTCPKCNQFVCAEHFLIQFNCCTACRENETEENEAAYNRLLFRIYEDGIVTAEERAELKQAQKDLGLSDAEAKKLESKFAAKTKKLGLTRAEQMDLRRADDALLQSEVDEKILARLHVIHDSLPNDEKVLATYFRVLARKNPDEVFELIENLDFDNKDADLAAIDIHLQNGRLDLAEKKIQEAKEKWPDDFMISCAEARQMCALANRTKQSEVVEDAERIINALPEPGNKIEEDAIACINAMLDFVSGVNDKAIDELDSTPYWIETAKQIFAISPEERKQIEDRKAAEIKAKQEKEKAEAARLAAEQKAREEAERKPFMDPRDGQFYKTVKIGNQLWFAENLRYKTPNARAYGENEKYVSQHGFLYNLNDAVNAVPPGCHIPSADEWNELFAYAMNSCNGTEIANVLKSSNKNEDGINCTNWKSGDGQDLLGFRILPSGRRGGFRGDSYENIEKCAYLATGSLQKVKKFTESGIVTEEEWVKSYSYSIRCIVNDDAYNAKLKAENDARVAKAKAEEEARIAKKKAEEEARIAEEKAKKDARIAEEKAEKDEKRFNFIMALALGALPLILFVISYVCYPNIFLAAMTFLLGLIIFVGSIFTRNTWDEGLYFTLIPSGIAGFIIIILYIIDFFGWILS